MVALSRVFLFRLSALEADLDGGAHLGWAPSCYTLVLAVDRTLIPPLAPLKSGVMTTSGAIMTALASSLTKVFSKTRFMACGTPSKLKVELEPVYRAKCHVGHGSTRMAWDQYFVRERGMLWCGMKRGLRCFI